VSPPPLWRNREFVKLWAASAVSDVGSQITTLALPLMAAVTLGATAWQMGVLAASSSAPTLVVGLFAGVCVDRMRRRSVLIAADIGRAVFLSTIPVAAMFGVVRMELLYAVALCAGALTVLFDVAHLAYTPSLVGRDQIIDGNSKLETTWSVSQVIGPSVGGVLVSRLTAPIAILVDAASFLASALFLARIRAPEAAPVRSGAGGVFREISEGLRVVFGHRLVRYLAGCSATTTFFGQMFMAVYILYMTRDLGLDAMGVGMVLATGGIGSLTGALVSGPATRRFGPGPTMIAAQIGFGLTGLLMPLAVFVPSIALPMVVASEFGQWMTILVYWINAVSVRQTVTPDRLQGRVNATMRFLVGGATPIGALIGGALGGVIGVPLTLVVAEIGILFGVLWLVLSPVRSLRRMPEPDAGEIMLTPTEATP
jgi:MFS family permease